MTLSVLDEGLRTQQRERQQTPRLAIASSQSYIPRAVDELLALLIVVVALALSGLAEFGIVAFLSY